MRRLLLVLALSGCGGSAAVSKPAPTPPAPARPPAPRGVTLSIVGMNDLHGQFRPDPGGERGGLAIMGGYLANLRAARAADGGAVLLFDGGDAFQGTLESNLSEGAVVIAAYNVLGVDAMTLGNHEHDYGPVGPAVTPQGPGDDPQGAIKARAAEAKFPIVAANTVDAATGQPVSWPNVQPTVMLDRAGVKIGVIGLTTMDTPSSTMTANVRGLDFQPLAPTMTREATKLRAAGAQVVVVVAHAGGKCKSFDNPRDLSSCSPGDEMFQALPEVPAGLVDVVVAGHTHDGVAHFVNGVAVIEGYSYGKAFGRVDLTVTGGKLTDVKIFQPHELCLKAPAGKLRCDPKDPAPREPVIYEGKPVTPDAQVAAVLAPAVESAAERRAEKLGPRVEKTVMKSYDHESALGNLVADLMLDARPKAALAITNGGGLRAHLAEGELTYGSFYELYPFDNRFAMAEMTGAEVVEMVRKNLLSDKGIMSMAGGTVTAVCKNGQLEITVRRGKGGKPIKPKDKLLIATSDFLASGGADAMVPVDASKVKVEDEIVREALVKVLRKKGKIVLHGDDPKLFDPKKPRLAYPGDRPVKCP